MAGELGCILPTTFVTPLSLNPVVVYEEVCASPVLDRGSPEYKQLDSFYNQGLGTSTYHSAYYPLFKKLPTYALEIYSDWLHDSRTVDCGGENFNDLTSEKNPLYTFHLLYPSLKQFLAEEEILVVSYNYRENY